MAYDVNLVIAEAKRSAGMVALAAQQAETATQNLIQLNGRYYHVAITSLKRSHSITDGENAGRTKPPLAEMIRDIVGVFISYTAVFEVKSTDVWEYDDMILTLAQPVDYLPVVMPYGQGSLAFDAYITKIDDELLNNIGGVRRWGNCTVTFTPMRAQIRP